MGEKEMGSSSLQKNSHLINVQVMVEVKNYH